MVKTLDVSFGDLEPEILRSKGGPGPSAWGAPSGRGRGVRSTLLQVTLGISCCDLCSECVVPGPSPNNPWYPRGFPGDPRGPPWDNDPQGTLTGPQETLRCPSGSQVTPMGPQGTPKDPTVFQGHQRTPRNPRGPAGGPSEPIVDPVYPREHPE